MKNEAKRAVESVEIGGLCFLWQVGESNGSAIGGKANTNGWTTAGKGKQRSAGIRRKPAGEPDWHARGEAELWFIWDLNAACHNASCPRSDNRFVVLAQILEAH